MGWEFSKELAPLEYEGMMVESKYRQFDWGKTQSVAAGNDGRRGEV